MFVLDEGVRGGQGNVKIPLSIWGKVIKHGEVKSLGARRVGAYL